jgi:membrane protease YdiL (CAAX protease family)
MSAQRQLSIWVALSLWTAGVAGAAVYGSWHGYSGRAFVITLGVLAFYFLMQLLFAAGNLGERLGRRVGPQRGVLVATLPFFAYLIYLVGTNSFTWWRVLIAAAYVVTPVLLVISAGHAKPGAWQDYLAMLAIFLPLKTRVLNVLWPYLGAQIGYVGTMLLAINVALAAFLFVRQLNGIGYNFVWGRDAALAVLINFGAIAVIVIPLGTWLHFIRFDPTLAHWKSLPADAFGILLLTAWPEEFLFRGLLQNCLSCTLSSENGGWIVASIVFGLAHITNNGVFPNWRYALLAVIAGLFYGRTWRKSNSIFPAAIVHGLVDTIWHLTFRTL